MANVLFIGDIHGGHKNICNFRPQFSSEKEHLEFIKHNYHTKVTKRDKVFFMGDIAFSFEALQEISTWAGHQKILICGNHDLDRIGMKTVSQYYDEVYSLLKYKEFWLSNCPIHPDELRGKFNIHGHCVDLNTEILTSNGWKFRSELTKEDLIYSYDSKENIDKINKLLTASLNNSLKDLSEKNLELENEVKLLKSKLFLAMDLL